LFGYEHYGDAPVRIELAERWAQDPHLWRGYLEAWQYGPLHLTLIGALVRLLGDRVVAARLLSLAGGLLGVWPLYRIAAPERRRAGALVALGQCPRRRGRARPSPPHRPGSRDARPDGGGLLRFRAGAPAAPRVLAARGMSRRHARLRTARALGVGPGAGACCA